MSMPLIASKKVAFQSSLRSALGMRLISIRPFSFHLKLIAVLCVVSAANDNGRDRKDTAQKQNSNTISFMQLNSINETAFSPPNRKIHIRIEMFMFIFRLFQFFVMAFFIILISYFEVSFYLESINKLSKVEIK